MTSSLLLGNSGGPGGGGGGTPDDNSVTSAKIVNGAVANIDLANMVEARLKGRAAGAGTGAPTDLTDTEVRTLLGIDALAVTTPLEFDPSPPADTQVITLPGVLYEYGTLSPGSAVASQTAETSLLASALTIAADTLEVGDFFELYVYGTWRNFSGADRQTDWRVRFGGTSGVVVAAHRIPTTLVTNIDTTRWFRMLLRGDIIDSSGTKTRVSSSFSLGGTNLVAGSSDLFTNTRETTSSTIDFTGSLDLQVTADHDVSDANLSAAVTAGRLLVAKAA